MHLRTSALAGLAMLMATTACAPVLAQTNSTVVATPESVGPNAPVNPFSERGGALPAVIRWLATQDVKLTAIGDEGGLTGYLGEAANGRYQTFYPAPDGEHLLTGILFDSTGQNVTNVQVARMLERFRTVAQAVPGADISSLVDVPDDALQLEDPDKPIVDSFRAAGMKVTEVDTRDGGLRAFAVEAPASEEGGKSLLQFFYVLPDERFAVAGILTKRGGVNVTGLQVAGMQQKYLVETEAAKHNSSAVATGVRQPEVPSSLLVTPIPAQPAAAADQEATPSEADAQQAAIAEAFAPPAPADEAPATAPAESVGPSDAAAAPSPVFEDVAVSTSAREAADRFHDPAIASEDLLAAVNNSVFFTVGRPNLPAIYMVADPQCPFCHQTWTQLRPLVFAGKVQVRVIMIAGLRGSDPIARSILSQPDPSAVWIAGQGSMDNVRVDAPPAVGSAEWTRAGQYLDMNSTFLTRFKVTSTPFLAYVDETGRSIVSRGVPNDFNDYLAAIEPSTPGN